PCLEDEEIKFFKKKALLGTEKEQKLAFQILSFYKQPITTLYIPLLNGSPNEQRIGIQGLLQCGKEGLCILLQILEELSLTEEKMNNFARAVYEVLLRNPSSFNFALPQFLCFYEKIEKPFWKKRWEKIILQLSPQDNQLLKIAFHYERGSARLKKIILKLLVKKKEYALPALPGLLYLYDSSSEMKEFCIDRIIKILCKASSKLVSLWENFSSKQGKAIQKILPLLEVNKRKEIALLLLQRMEGHLENLTFLASIPEEMIWAFQKLWKSQPSQKLVEKMNVFAPSIHEKGLYLAYLIWPQSNFAKEGRRLLKKLVPYSYFSVYASLYIQHSHLRPFPNKRLFIFGPCQNLLSKKIPLVPASLQWEAGKSLFEPKASSLTWLVHFLGWKDKARNYALSQLKKISPSLLPDLIKIFFWKVPKATPSHKPWPGEKIFLKKIKESLVQVVVSFGPKALPFVMQGLLRGQKEAQPYLAQCLLQFREKSIPYLLKALPHLGDNEKVLILKILYELGPLAKQAAPLLVKELDSKNLRVQYYAGETLAKIGKPALPLLQKTLKSCKTYAVRKKALYILQKMGPASIELKETVKKMLEKAKDESLRTKALATLVSMGIKKEELSPFLVQFFKSHPSEDRFLQILRALKGFQDPSLVPILLPFRVSPSFYIRKQVAETLRSLGKPTSKEIPELIRLLGHSDYFVRMEAGKYLRQIGEAVIEPLMGVMGEKIRGKEALNILAAFGEKALPTLIEASKDQSLPLNIRQKAIGTIGNIASSKGAFFLLSHYPHFPPKLKKAIRVALLKINPHGWEGGPFVRLLKNQNPWVRKKTLLLLTEMSSIPKKDLGNILESFQIFQEKDLPLLAKILEKEEAYSIKLLMKHLPKDKVKVVKLFSYLSLSTLAPLLKGWKEYPKNRNLIANIIMQRPRQEYLLFIQVLKKNISLDESLKSILISWLKKQKDLSPALLWEAFKEKTEIAAKVFYLKKRLAPFLLRRWNQVEERKYLLPILAKWPKEGWALLVSTFKKKDLTFQKELLAFLEKENHPSLICALLPYVASPLLQKKLVSLLLNHPQGISSFIKILQEGKIAKMNVYTFQVSQKTATTIFPQIQRAFQSTSPKRRLAALQLLLYLSYNHSIYKKMILQGLLDKNPKVSQLAAKVILDKGSIYLPELLKIYSTSLEKEDRHGILKILLQIPHTKTVPLLIQNLSNTSPALRLQAYLSLAKYKPKDQRIWTLLVKGLEDETPKIRLALLEEFQRMGKKSIYAIPKVIPLLADPSLQISRRAQSFLKAHDKPLPSQTEELLLLLGYPELEVRKQAIGYLKKIPQVHQRIENIFLSTSFKVKKGILDFLYEIGPTDKEIPLIMTLFHCPDPELRKKAAKVIGKLGKKGLPMLSRALKSEKEMVRIS
ncbi:MAG: HEAT repeat domain-containing protein, partial [Planctomycetota bacterium]